MHLNLQTEMNRNSVSMDDIADYLGVHRNTVSSKIHGHSKWLLEEAMAIRERFFPYTDIHYLFKRYRDTA